MQREKCMRGINGIFKDKRLSRYSLFIIVTMFFVYIFYFIIKNLNVILAACAGGIASFLGALAPLFIGIVLAYIIDPAVERIDGRFISRIYKNLDDPVKNLKRQKRQRLISTLLTYLIIMAVVTALIFFFATLLVGKIKIESFSQMIESITSYIVSCEHAFKDWVANIPSDVLSEKIAALGDTILKWLSHHFNAQNTIDQVTSIGGGIVKFLLGVIVSFWFVMDKVFFVRLWNRFFAAVLPGRGSEVLNKNLKEIDAILSQFVRGILLDTVIIAVLSSIVLSILGLKFAVFIGVFAGLCNVIPYFGPIMGMIPAFVVGLINGGLAGGIVPVIALLVIQQVDGNFIYPKVVGSSTGLHPVTVLLAVVVGGVYGGILGMLIAVPVTGIIKLYVVKLVKYCENRKKKSADDAPRPALRQ